MITASKLSSRAGSPVASAPEKDSLAFRRIDGNDPSGPIYFLPWRTSFALALAVGMIGLKRWRACYELPLRFVSADPEQSAETIKSIQQDVDRKIQTQGAPSLVIGFSIGTVPATLVASRYRLPLWSFASADRGDLMIWQSPAARKVRDEARHAGLDLHDFARSLRGLCPIDCVSGVDPRSRFVSGAFDRYIPRRRSQALMKEAARVVPAENIRCLPLGHFGVILSSSFLQRRWSR